MAECIVSIIIPMYNSEKYIGTCLDSIIKSDLPCDVYEIIVVDDGSSDNGAAVVKSYIDQYSNVHYFLQSNQGQSSARNNGIKRCRGKYVWCVDSDDKVDAKLKRVIGYLENGPQLDILAFQLKEVTESGKFIKNECSQPAIQQGVILLGRDAIISGYNPSSVCALLIRREFMMENSLFFMIGITHQDVELSYRLFAKAQKVLFTKEAPYIYILHPNSTSQSVKPEKKIKYMTDELVIMQSFSDLAKTFSGKDEELKEVIEKRVNDILFGLCFSMFKHRNDWNKNGVNHAILKKMEGEGLYPVKVSFGNLKKNIFRLIFNQSFLFF